MKNESISGLTRQMEELVPSVSGKTMVLSSEIAPASIDASASSPPDLSPATTGIGREVRGVAGEQVDVRTGVVGEGVRDNLGQLEYEIGKKSVGEKRKSKIKIQSRDIEILRSLEIWGVLGLGQIQALHWKKQDSAQAVPLFFNEDVVYPGPTYRRLSQLASHGWIQIFRFAHAKQLYGLTEKGHEWLQDNGRSRLKTPLEDFSLATISHRIESAGVGLMMREFLRLPVWTERQTRYEFKRRGFNRGRFGVPDLIVEDAYGFKAVEMERTQKFKPNYESKWEKYRNHKWGFDRVLYFVPSRARAIALLKIADRYRANHVYAVDTPSFRESLGTCLFRNSDGEGYRLG